MAEAAAKTKRQVLKFSPLRPLERKLDEKGFSLSENLAKKSREKGAAKGEQQELIGKQKQAEELRLAEAQDVIARRGQIRTTGGRQSLIKTRRLRQVTGTQPLVPKA